tara:strand:+ start:2178 stop:2333 length:156 start_codon:yes stop_codon:yes gene_type:complete
MFDYRKLFKRDYKRKYPEDYTLTQRKQIRKAVRDLLVTFKTTNLSCKGKLK